MVNFHLNPFTGEAFPWIGGDLQTLRDWVFPPVSGADSATEFTISLKDGDSLTYRLEYPATIPKAVMIIVHGLGGSAQSQHARALSDDALASGYICMRVNMRGAGSSRPLCHQTYHAQRGSDLLHFITAARTGFPDLPIFMIAHSLGGSVALNMLLDFPEEAMQLSGMITISAPLDLIESSAQFHKIRNRPYMRYILSGLKDLSKNCPGLDTSYQDAAAAAKSLVEFDEYVTAPVNGFPSLEAYYKSASTAHRLSNANRPLLLIHARNDPWIPVTPYLSATVSPTSKISLSTGGGHIGFHERGQAGQRWHIKTAIDFCDYLCR